MAEQMKPSGIDWIGDIPDEWDITKVRFVTKLRSEQGFYNSDDKYIGLENISSYTGEYISTESEYDAGIYDLYKTGDLLFSKLRPYLAKALIADDCGFCTGELAVIKEYNGDIRYLFYYMLSDGFLKMVDASTYGAKMPRASWDYIKNLQIPVIGKAEQQAIANFLDKECAQIDSIAADLEKQIALLQQYKKSLITETVTKGLDKSVPMKDSGVEWIGKIPAHWKAKRLKYVMNNFDAQRKAIEAQNRSQDGEILYDYYGASGAIDKIDDYIFDETSILIGEDGANLVLRNLPLIYIATGKYWVNNHAHILRPKSESDLYYMAHQMEIIDYSQFITGSAQPKLSQENLNNVFLVVPPLNEQQCIASYLEEKISCIDTIVCKKQEQLSTIQQHKKSLIYEYVTGKKRVKEVQ